MKQLLIMRHAKSSWSDGSATDHQRTLNQRGLRDAPRMGEFIAAQGLTPDWIAASTATRAQTTAELLAEHCGDSRQPEIDLVDDFYHAAPDVYLDYLAKLAPRGNPEFKTVMVVGHNPGLEKLVYRLAGRYETMPTAAIAQFQFELNNWGDIRKSESVLINVWRPKEI